MSVKLEPLADYIVAQNEEPQSITKSGIYIPSDSNAEKPKICKVLAVGKNVKSVKISDRIVYKSYSSTEVKIENSEYIIVKEEDVLAIVK